MTATVPIQAKDAARDDTPRQGSGLEGSFGPGTEGAGGGRPNRKLSTGGGGADSGSDVYRQLTPTDAAEIAHNWTQLQKQELIHFAAWGAGGPAAAAKAMAYDLVLTPVLGTLGQLGLLRPLPFAFILSVKDPAESAIVVEQLALAQTAAETPLLPKLARTTTESVLDSATAPMNGKGMNPVARAMQKHAVRPGSWLARFAAVRTPVERTEIGRQLIQDTLETGDVSAKDHPEYGDVVRVRGPDGSGIWFTANGDFIGFLERYTPR